MSECECHRLPPEDTSRCSFCVTREMTQSSDENYSRKMKEKFRRLGDLEHYMDEMIGRLANYEDVLRAIAEDKLKCPRNGAQNVLELYGVRYA